MKNTSGNVVFGVAEVHQGIFHGSNSIFSGFALCFTRFGRLPCFLSCLISSVVWVTDGTLNRESGGSGWVGRPRMPVTGHGPVSVRDPSRAGGVSRLALVFKFCFSRCRFCCAHAALQVAILVCFVCCARVAFGFGVQVVFFSLSPLLSARRAPM